MVHEISIWNSNLSLSDWKTHPIIHGTLLGANLEEILKSEVNCCDSQISYLSAGQVLTSLKIGNQELRRQMAGDTGVKTQEFCSFVLFFPNVAFKEVI